jgi:uracil phosphoribosyltransferase
MLFTLVLLKGFRIICKGVVSLVVNVLDHLLIQDRLAMLRRSGISATNFRSIMIEIGRYISYEFANTLEKESITVETPLGTSESSIIKEKDKLVVINVLRAAIPLVEGIMNVFTESECGVVGAWREDKPPFNINLNYIRIPPLDNKIVLIADPMLATGSTMNAILKEIKNYGTPKRLVLLNVIASKEGIRTVSSANHDLEIYTCAIDSEVNKEGYIVPGLGDAGDICFGKPSQK